MADPRDSLVVTPENSMTRQHAGRASMTTRGKWLGTIAAAFTGVVVMYVVADAHDLFLRPTDFVVVPGSDVHVRVLNGTFTSSESPVTRERLRDLTVVGDHGPVHPDTTTWTAVGKESSWHVRVDEAGTFLLGASVHPKTIRLKGADFNKYLREDGLPDVLAARRTSGELDKPAHERYSKHVKSLIRAEGPSLRAKRATGDTAFAHVLGYPAELVPLEDPYDLRPGAALTVRALVDGTPVPGQVVLAGGRTAKGTLIPERAVRTDEHGIAHVSLRSTGVWYVKFIRMRSVPDAAKDSVNYESKWATLTFAVR